MEHKSRFIGKRYLSPRSGLPVAVLSCKFQPSVSINSSQQSCVNQASASEAQTQQHSLNNSLGDTFISLMFHLGVQLLNSSTSIRTNTSPQPCLHLSSMATGAPHLPRP
ncbi:hypothetical protein TNCV_4742621 [Trichonephila clavipes]|nr:hypothetical protein TNCV_4742621 [Trichonephila clavipes]